MAELDEVSLHDIRFAKYHGIRVDSLRRTSYPENVQQLRVIAKQLWTPEDLKLKRVIIKRGPTSKKGYPAPRIGSLQKND